MFEPSADPHGVMLIGGFPEGRVLRFRSPMRKVRYFEAVETEVIQPRPYVARPLMRCPYFGDE